jgi:MOSC domain-containing protein
VVEAPTVKSLFTTPIKGFALDRPEHVTIDRQGAVGDRDFFLVDDNHRLLSATRTGAFLAWHARFDGASGVLTLVSRDGRILEDTVVAGRPVSIDVWGRDVPGQVVEGPWRAWLSEVAGQPVSLVRANDPGRANDEAPVTILSEESVAKLGRGAGTAAPDIRRFRMLVNIAGVGAYEEETWSSQKVRVGSALLRMAGQVPRCIATTRNPETGTKDLKTLRLIADSRGPQANDFGTGLNLGAYAYVIEPGVIRLGDRVELT